MPAPHDGQADLADFQKVFSGIRKIQTLRKLPIQAPQMKATQVIGEKIMLRIVKFMKNIVREMPLGPFRWP